MRPRCGSCLQRRGSLSSRPSEFHFTRAEEVRPVTVPPPPPRHERPGWSGAFFCAGAVVGDSSEADHRHPRPRLGRFLGAQPPSGKGRRGRGCATGLLVIKCDVVHVRMCGHSGAGGDRACGWSGKGASCVVSSTSSAARRFPAPPARSRTGSCRPWRANPHLHPPCGQVQPDPAIRRCSVACSRALPTGVSRHEPKAPS
jgi:hypothetical protein